MASALPPRIAIINSKGTISESELVAGLKDRDSAVFEYLYDHYSAALYGVVTRIIADETIAEEVLHDAFLRIWNKIDSYDPAKGRLFTWMLNLTRNLAIDKTRTGEINRTRKTDSLDKIVDKDAKGGVGHLQVDAIGLAEILAKLPAEQRFVVEYLYLKGYTQSEVAEEFNIPLGTVKTRTRLAMLALRTLLNVK